MTTTDNDDDSQKEDEQSVLREIETDQQPQPKATGSIEHAGNQPVAPVA